MVKPNSATAKARKADGLVNASIGGEKLQDLNKVVSFIPQAAKALAASAPPREACDKTDKDQDGDKENDPPGSEHKSDRASGGLKVVDKASNDDDAIGAALDDTGNYGDAECDDSHPDSDSDSCADLDKTEKKETTTGASSSPPAHEDKKIRGRPSACVFVASLSSLHTDDQLNKSVSEHFAQWGQIALVKVLRDTNNRPYAFVQYSNEKEASAALEGAQHTILHDRLIRVEPARVNRTLYVTPLKSSLANEETITAALSAFGEVEQLVATKVPLGAYQAPANWYAKFAYRDDAIRAFASLRVGGDWSVEWSQNLDTPDREGSAAIDKQSIFIGQLDHNVTKELLEERFGKHGVIADCNLIIRPPDPTKLKENGEQRNGSFAFVKFETEEAAAEAVEQENHTVFMDKTMHVQYRELNHHAHSAAYKSSSEFRLNLAPPPISMPKYTGYYGDAILDLHRVNARHSNMPVTPLPYNRRPPLAFNALLSKWSPQGRPQGGYYSPAGEVSMQVHEGSSPYSSPSPSNSASPASNRQSPLSNASSAPSDRSYSWGDKRYGFDSRQNNLYSPPRGRGNFGGGYGGKQLGPQQYGDGAKGYPQHHLNHRSGKYADEFESKADRQVDSPYSKYPSHFSKSTYGTRGGAQQGAAGEAKGRGFGSNGTQPSFGNKPDAPGQSQTNGQADAEKFYPKGPKGGLPQHYGHDVSKPGHGYQPSIHQAGGRGNGPRPQAVNSRRK